MSRLRLAVVSGVRQGSEIDLPDDGIVVGRGDDCGLQLVHHSISRRHARIVPAQSGALVEDLGSKNGSWVDDVTVHGTALAGMGQEIRCGDVRMRLVSDLDASAQTPPSRHARAIDPEPHTAAPLGTLLRTRADAAARRDGADETAARLRILLETSAMLSQHHALDALFRAIPELLREVLDADRVVLVSRSSGGALSPRAAATRMGSIAAERAPYSASIVRTVIARELAAVFDDVSVDASFADAASVAAQGIRACLCAPLCGRERVLGALYVDDVARSDRWDANDVELLVAFANQAAIALDNAMLAERLVREAVARNTLLRFFPPSVAQRLADGADVTLGTVETEITALFCDISGFTALGARTKPTEIVELLNAYFPEMSAIVFAHGGTLEKYIGDALLAVWGAPLRSDDDVVRATRAAVAMQRRIVELDARWAGGEPLAIHVGLHTGMAAAGNIGSPAYVQYATIGDTTNVAARICDEAGPGEILVSDVVAERLRNDGGIALEPIGERVLKGLDQPRTLHRVRF